MKKQVLAIVIIALNLLLLQAVNAAVKLPAIISSNMVLQQNTTVKLWGWADANEKITIETSWLKEIIKCEADKQGNWMVDLETTNSKELQSVIIKSKTSNLVLDNILFGEVWLCSGQSNMEMPLKGFTAQPTYGSNMAVARSKNSNLHLFTVERFASKIPIMDIEKYQAWQEASPETVLGFSTVAYFFGQQLQEILDVPVGLIHTSWGGSSIEAWMSKEVLSSFQQINLDDIDISEKTQHIPTVLFNSMINPLIPFTIKGALWYQGESNRHEPENYKKLFPAMVKDWRERWGIGDFPFYYVQIAPYSYDNYDAFQTVRNSAFMREAQLQCLDVIPNSGIAITTDVGDETWIHPPKKKEVADRLLFNALHQTYGYETVAFAGPVYMSHEEKDAGLLLKFDNVETGVYAYDQLEGFEIAGDDRIFYSAEAKIVNRKEVYVKSEKVSDPKEVRYAWRNWIVGSLYNGSMLPASSFRTDVWDDAIQFGN